VIRTQFGYRALGLGKSWFSVVVNSSNSAERIENCGEQVQMFSANVYGQTCPKQIEKFMRTIDLAGNERRQDLVEDLA
jgi:hypothetical protein